MRKLIAISGINFKDSPRQREELNAEAILDYSRAYREEEALPPPILYRTELHGLLVSDGMHRLEALQCNSVRQALCEVRVGTRADCFNTGILENLRHGIRRTGADKRQSIGTAIAIHPEMADLKIAELCHVSHSTVAEVRKKLEASGAINERKTIKTSDGKTRSSKAYNKENRLPSRQCHSLKEETNESNDLAGVPKGGLVRLQATGKSPANAPVVVDATGYPIPERAIAIWERRDTAGALIADLRSVRSFLEAAVKSKDILFSEVNLNAADCELESLISRITAAIPYAVCPSCQGKLPEKCKGCSGRGMVSKTKFERTDPALLKVRQMNIKKEKL